MVEHNMRVELILDRSRRHRSLDPLHDFEDAILGDTRVSPVVSANKLVAATTYNSWRIVRKVGFGYSVSYVIKTRIMGNHAPKEGINYFAVMMGYDPKKYMPHCWFSGRKALYLFDAWPITYAWIKQFVYYFNIDHVFLSSSQAVEDLNTSGCATPFCWLPEGITPDRYRQHPYCEKNIDVLQFGRKYDKYHQLIVGPLEKQGKVYLYEKAEGQAIFSTREQFVDGLARSKISICVPCSITNPNRSGHVQTMTVRYLESMVSKCLIVGHAPPEMIELFGYNPLVEIDMSDPAGQIISVLNDFTSYVPLIEKNYAAVTENHTWSKRWSTIAQILFPS